MKPRLFVGSSVEGLTIAYALQKNLRHSAEVTIWDQGVFKLSATSLESLADQVSTCDFSAFVFSPDDVVKIRGKSSRAVRDNVILELGLFVGILGKERCFVLVPEGSEDLRIPTDLIGLTPGQYESNRSDGNFQAATGPVCQEIRDSIERLGLREGRTSPDRSGSKQKQKATGDPEKPEDQVSKRTPVEASSDLEWLDPFLKGDWAEAIDRLQERLTLASDELKKYELECWIARAKHHIDPENGRERLEGLIDSRPSSHLGYRLLSYAHAGLGRFRQALAAAERGLEHAGFDASLASAKADYLGRLGLLDQKEEFLRDQLSENPLVAELYIALAEHYRNLADSAHERTVLFRAQEQLPNSEEILQALARHFEKAGDSEIALLFWNELCLLKKERPEYLTLRANVYLDLKLHDLAMRDYRHANKLAKKKQAWIVANIGNLLQARGLFREGIEYLKRSLELEEDSEYSHQRLAVAIESRDAQVEKLVEIEKQARQRLEACRDATVDLAEEAAEGDGAESINAQ